MPKVINGLQFYSTKEVAEMAGVHRLTLLRWIREGKLADVPRDRNGWRIFSEDIAQQIAEYSTSTAIATSPNQTILFPTGSKR